MYRKFVTPVYIINMVLQSLFSLVAPIELMLLFAYLLVSYAAAPTWIYVLFIMLGVFSGLYSMVTFILSASRALEALERQYKEKEESTSGVADAPTGTMLTDFDEDDTKNEE